MGKIDLQIQTMAHELGDDFGFEDSTVEYIASELQLSEDEVRAVLDSDYDPERDGQPDEAQEWYDFDPDC
jgi:hypothetical protein